MKRYPGVSPFTAEQKNIFYGREYDIDKLKKLILLRKQVLLYAKSGIGKTSLLNAGVLPLLEDKFLIIRIRFFAYDEKNPQNPVSRIFEAIKKTVHNYNDINNTILDDIIVNREFKPTLWYYFKKIQLTNAKKQFILVFDQFEEIFSYPEEYLKQFKDEIYELTKIDIPDYIMQLISEKPEIEKHSQIDELYEAMSVKTVYAIRSDRLSSLNNLSDKMPDIQKIFYELNPLDKKQAEKAIIKPAVDDKTHYETIAFSYADSAVKKIISALTSSEKGDQKIEGTQLQIVCQQIENIAEDRQNSGVNRVEIQEVDLPEFKDIFLRFYKDAVASADHGKKLGLSDSIQKFVEDQLIRRKQRIALDALVCREFLSNDTLSKLVDTHLLRTERNSTGGFSYELSHDTLIGAILVAKADRENQEYLKKIEIDKQNQIRALKEKDEAIRLIEIQESLFKAEKLIRLFSPDEATISKQLENVLIYDKPKNIINGDFYFLKQIEEIIYIGVFDSSGSGIHGTLLRVMGYSILENIIQDNNTPVNELLNIFREKVTKMFKVDVDNATDGFDGALCALNIKNRTIEYAGAKLALYYLNNGVIESLKPSSLSIIYNPLVEDRNVFELTKIDIQEENQFYLSTDGFSDQLHHTTYKKFQKRQFQKLLDSAHSLPSNGQADLLDENFSNWKQDTEQTDDILVIGFKVKL